MKIKNAILVHKSNLSREVTEKFPAQNSGSRGAPVGWGLGLLGVAAAAASGETSGRPPCGGLQRQKRNLHAEPLCGDTVSKGLSHLSQGSLFSILQ